MLLVILDLVRPDGQSCLEKEARVNDGLFGQMWISHPKGIKYSLMVRHLRHPRGCLSLNAHSGKRKQGHDQPLAGVNKKWVSSFLQYAEVKSLDRVYYLERVVARDRLIFRKRRETWLATLIETPHTGEACLDLIKVLNAQGYLWNFDWGCKAGIHSGWATIEAENEAQARLAVPPLVRTRARIVKLNKFDGSTIEDCEKQAVIAAGTGGIALSGAST